MDVSGQICIQDARLACKEMADVVRNGEQEILNAFKRKVISLMNGGAEMQPSDASCDAKDVSHSESEDETPKRKRKHDED